MAEVGIEAGTRPCCSILRLLLGLLVVWGAGHATIHRLLLQSMACMRRRLLLSCRVLLLLGMCLRLLLNTPGHQVQPCLCSVPQVWQETVLQVVVGACWRLGPVAQGTVHQLQLQGWWESCW